MKTKNQVHSPRPRKVRIDNKGNEHVKLWLKDHDTTMLITKDLTHNAAIVLINQINTLLISLGAKRLNKERFLITK